jgi:hypothetical protein
LRPCANKNNVIPKRNELGLPGAVLLFSGKAEEMDRVRARYRSGGKKLPKTIENPSSGGYPSDVRPTSRPPKKANASSISMMMISKMILPVDSSKPLVSGSSSN